IRSVVRACGRGTAEIESGNIRAEGSKMAMRLGRKIGAKAVRGMGVVLAFVWGLMAASEAHGQAPAGGGRARGLPRVGPGGPAALYRQGTPAAIPSGRVRGTALLAPGTWRTRPLACGTRLVWQGKVFEPAARSAVNRFFGMRIIRAQVYQGPSWLDGAPALIL